jgi:hypothetical protein
MWTTETKLQEMEKQYYGMKQLTKKGVIDNL